MIERKQIGLAAAFELYCRRTVPALADMQAAGGAALAGRWHPWAEDDMHHADRRPMAEERAEQSKPFDDYSAALRQAEGDFRSALTDTGSPGAFFIHPTSGVPVYVDRSGWRVDKVSDFTAGFDGDCLGPDVPGPRDSFINGRWQPLRFWDDEFLKFCDRAAPSAELVDRRRTGPKTNKGDDIKRRMLDELERGELTPQTLHDMIGKVLEQRYGAGRTTCTQARIAALSEFNSGK